MLPCGAVPVNDFLHFLEIGLEAEAAQGRARQLRGVPAGCLSFCDNDYLGLANHKQVKAAAIAAAKKYGTGGAASRLVAGNHPLYQTLEQALARAKGSEAALVFPSGLAMNLGVIPALAGAGDLILADKLCHASLIDGALASRAKLLRFPHNDGARLEALLQTHRERYQHVFILTETVFSMDGDTANIPALLALAERYNAQIIADDAHGFGVLPKLPTHERLIQLGTLSKAVGSLGGYVCALQIVVDWLVHRCRSIIYTTALPPPVLAASISALEVMQQEPQRGQRAMYHAANFCAALGLRVPESPIVPLMMGKSASAMALAESLEGQGYYVVAIRPPTVPRGSARLRFTFTARHSEAEVGGLIAAVKALIA